MASRGRSGSGLPGYAERLRAPWWWYPVAVAAAVLLGLEFAVAVAGWLGWLPLALLIPAFILLVVRMSSATLEVDGEILTIGGNRLPVERVDRVIELRPDELRRLVGRHADPAALTFIRSWIGPGLQVVLKPGGAHPYWVVSTRRPSAAAAALRAASISIA